MSGPAEQPWQLGGMVCRESVRLPWRLEPEVDALWPVNMVEVDARRQRERERNRALTDLFLVISATDRAFRPLAPPLVDSFELRTVILPEPGDA